MPSAHRRIALVRDPEIDAALDATRDRLDPPPASDAGHVRQLALLGARMLNAASAPEPRRRVLAIPGVRPARRDLLSVTDPLPMEGLPTQDDLDWVRG